MDKLQILIDTIKEDRTHLQIREALKTFSRSDFDKLLENGSINERDHQILTLHYIKGADFRFVGDLLGYSESAMKKIHLKILDKLENKL